MALKNSRRNEDLEEAGESDPGPRAKDRQREGSGAPTENYRKRKNEGKFAWSERASEKLPTKPGFVP